MQRHIALCTPESPLRIGADETDPQSPTSQSTPSDASSQDNDMHLMPTLTASSLVLSPHGATSPKAHMYCCFMCGKAFMNKSLAIHLPLCQAKWLAEEELRHPDVQRLLPAPPPD